MSLTRRAFTSSLAMTPLATAKPHSGQQASEASASDDAVSPAWQSRLFDDHQLETVAVLADLIIPTTDTPGGRDALVHQHLDHILAESPEGARTKFLEGLWWLDGYCLRTMAKPFKDLAAAEQMQTIMLLYGSSAPDLKPGAAFIDLAKTWTAKIYYSTQIGERELNKQGRAPSSYVSACGA